MAAPVGEKTPAARVRAARIRAARIRAARIRAARVASRRVASRRVRPALLWVGLAVAVAVAFAIAVTVLNATVYSASGFVRGYLDALDAGDTTSALAFAGIQPTDRAGDALLTVPETGLLGGIAVVADTPAAGGSHLVTTSFRDPAGRAHRTEFTVRPEGRFGGLFTRWIFATAPTASLDVTPLHDARFTANGVQIASENAGLATRYSVLAPAVVALAHDSTYLTAPKKTVVSASVGGVATATVTVAPRPTFTEKVRQDVSKYLRTSCVPQRVLLPAGCPFGQQVDDRLTSSPTWTMAAYPPVRLTATATSGVWRVSGAAGRAHLRVGAQSLYDGHEYTIDEDVPFTIAYVVTIGADGGLTILPE
jgi:hypothetical protein